LPKGDDAPLGFTDWYDDGQTHYNLALDPLNQTNFEADLLPPLQGKLDAVNIRHVVMILLESTRQDVFPLRKDDYIWKKLEEEWEDGTLPPAVQERLATLTQTANWVTGDYDDGFQHEHTRRRGGINAVNNTPSATYTLKSCAGTLCGISPLTADGNAEYTSHIYQPCLPHIFKLFNSLRDSAARPAWNNSFIMSVTGQYDSQYQLLENVGYNGTELIDTEYMESGNAAFPPPDREYLNYQGWEEEILEDYLVDAFKTSKADNTRLFLSHITSTAHYPYEIPETETYVPVTPEDGSYYAQDMSRYLNAIGYVDRWIGRVLDIIEEQGAANETLVVFIGDHGIPLAETGGISPWGIHNIGAFRVPLVFSHPNLPVIQLQESVTAMSIVPTILDLLIETGSLSDPERGAAKDLLRNYEGQSLIRSLERPEGETRQRWQFTAISPGGQGVSVRSMDEPRWRMVVPLIEDLEWWFSDLEQDAHEEDSIGTFGFVELLRAVEEKHGIEAAQWAEEAAFVTRWWVTENHDRWRYNP
jgi:hypothetical protein